MSSQDPKRLFFEAQLWNLVWTMASTGLDIVEKYLDEVMNVWAAIKDSSPIGSPDRPLVLDQHRWAEEYARSTSSKTVLVATSDRIESYIRNGQFSSSSGEARHTTGWMRELTIPPGK